MKPTFVGQLVATGCKNIITKGINRSALQEQRKGHGLHQVCYAQKQQYSYQSKILLDRKETSIKRATSDTESGGPRLQFMPSMLHTGTGTGAAVCPENEG